MIIYTCKVNTPYTYKIKLKVKGLRTMMNKEQRLIDELRMREELYGNDMLDEYFYYADDIEDLTQNLVHAVKLG